MKPRIEVVAIDCLMLRLFDDIAESNMPWMLAASERLRASFAGQLIDLVPSYTTLMVHYDGLALSPAQARELIDTLKENCPHGIRIGGGSHRLLVLVEVGELDLDVAERTGIHAIANHHARIERLAFQREFLLDDDLDFRAIGILRPRQQGPRCKP